MRRAASVQLFQDSPSERGTDRSLIIPKPPIRAPCPEPINPPPASRLVIFLDHHTPNSLWDFLSDRLTVSYQEARPNFTRETAWPLSPPEMLLLNKRPSHRSLDQHLQPRYFLKCASIPSAPQRWSARWRASHKRRSFERGGGSALGAEPGLKCVNAGAASRFESGSAGCVAGGGEWLGFWTQPPPGPAAPHHPAGALGTGRNPGVGIDRGQSLAGPGILDPARNLNGIALSSPGPKGGQTGTSLQQPTLSSPAAAALLPRVPIGH